MFKKAVLAVTLSFFGAQVALAHPCAVWRPNADGIMEEGIERCDPEPITSGKLAHKRPETPTPKKPEAAPKL